MSKVRALAKLVLNRGDGSIGVMSNRVAAVQLIILPEKAAINFGAFDFEHEVIGDIGSKLHVALACPEYLVQAVVGLHGPHVAVVAEVRRQPLTDQRSSLLHIFAQASHRFLLQHHGIGQIDDFVFADIVQSAQSPAECWNRKKPDTLRAPTENRNLCRPVARS